MYIGQIMHTNLITVPPETTLAQAQKIIKNHQIEHLLVVDSKQQLIGILSDRDLKQNWASPATTLSTHELHYLLEKVEVQMFMVKTPKTVTPETTVERAALIMQQESISSLPVMAKGKLVGIVTSTDVMGVLLQAIGMEEDSVRLSVLVRDQIGRLAEVTSLLKEAGINIQSFFCWPVRNSPGISHLVMRVHRNDGKLAIGALEGGGFKVLTQYEEDLEPFLPRASD